MDTSQHSTMESGKVVSVAPERNETEEAMESGWNVDAEIFVIWATGGIVLATLLGMLICLLATRKKKPRASTSTIRASSFNFYRPRNEETVSSIYRPRGEGGENPAYTVNNDDVNEWFNGHRPHALSSLAGPTDQVFPPDACIQGRQPWNSPAPARISSPNGDRDQQPITIPPSHVSENGPTYYSGPPPPSPPPPPPTGNVAGLSSRDDCRSAYIMENGDFMLDRYFLAAAPPPYTPYPEDCHTNIPADRSCTLPARSEPSYRVEYDYF